MELRFRWGTDDKPTNGLQSAGSHEGDGETELGVRRLRSAGAKASGETQEAVPCGDSSSRGGSRCEVPEMGACLAQSEDSKEAKAGGAA